MAKLISILAASVGGGLVLGASIRLGEAIGSSARGKQSHRSKAVPPSDHTQVNTRLDRLEDRLSQVSRPQAVAPDWQRALKGVQARIDRQQADVDAIQRQISGANRVVDSMGDIAGSMREEIHRQLREELDRRLSAVEANLRLSVEQSQRETVTAMVASIESRVAPRISRLETDVSNQSAAMAELRDCSLQSERSIQRLLGVLERVVGARVASGETTSGESAQTSAADGPRLAVMNSREQDESDAGNIMARRPASIR